MSKQTTLGQRQEISWARVGVFFGGIALLIGTGVAWKMGWFKLKTTESSVAPVQVQTLHKSEKQPAESAGMGQINPTPPDVAVELPTTEIGCRDAFRINWTGYAWNGQMPGILAIGGLESMTNSLTCKNGLHVTFTRKDSNDDLQKRLLDFATAVKGGQDNPQDGTHFINMMGDGFPAFVAGVNPLLAKLGADYGLKVVAAFGKSYGEDACMGPPEWAKNPQLLRGKTIIAVIKDGDWAVCVRFALENNICINPDEKVHDPNCLNFLSAPDNDYLKAVESWVGGMCADLPNKKTGAKDHVCGEGVATWTPGDVNAAKKGGLIKIASTRLYDTEMPSVLIGVDHWMKAHRKETIAFIKSGLEAGKQIKTSVRALRRAAAASAVAYNQETPAYWMKYYLGQREIDAAGLEVDLGGSQAFDLSDNMATFGLGGISGSYRDVYTIFGNTVAHYYPRDVPMIPKYETVVDTSYLEELLKQGPVAKPVIETPSYEAVAKAPTKTQVGESNWLIQFDTGKASFRPEAMPILQQMRSQSTISQTTVYEVHGYTDAQGNPEANLVLSNQRAMAVVQWLMQQDPARFKLDRFKVVPHGQQDAVGDNNTAAGRAQNRRVRIVSLFQQ